MGEAIWGTIACSSAADRKLALGCSQ